MASTKRKKSVRLSDAAADHDTVERAQEDLRRGKSASTAAGEFVREEIEHVREGKHGARSAKQAVAIGLSKARRAGVPLEAPARGRTSERTRQQAKRELAAGPKRKAPSRKRSQAITRALQDEPTSSVSKRALSRQARSAAKRRRAAGGLTVAGHKVAKGTQARKTAAKRRKTKTARKRSS